MASPRYGRDRLRPHRRGAPGGKRINLWYLMAGGFLLLYLLFLVRWRFGHVSDLEGSSPTEQLSNLRKASNPVHVQSDDALDVEIAAQMEEQRKSVERARQIPIKVVLSTTVPPTDAPVATTAAAVVTDSPRQLEKMAAGEELEGRVPGMPVHPEEESQIQVTEAAAAPEPEVAMANAVPVQIKEAAAAPELEVAVPNAVPVQVKEVAATPEAVVTNAVPQQVVPAEVAATNAVPVEVKVVAAAPEVAVTNVVPVQVAPGVVPSATRQQEVSGYHETMRFLENYQHNPDESLFLFFMCSDEQFKANDWSQDCVQGKKHVYDVFSKSPGRNRLVTVFAGSEKYWKHQNDFYNDADLRVKGLPCLMQWEGRNGRTSGMLVQRSLYDEPFLRYLFRNTDQPDVLFPADDLKNKQIITVNGYDAYVDAMVRYEHEENPVPTFLMMVSGRFRNNNRPWCPYCRYSELPLEYAFYHYAPKNARMIRVEVADSYSEWKKRNDFTRDENLQLKIVPLMFAIEQAPAGSPNGTKSINFTPHKIRYDELAPLRQFFTSFA
ncbi:hypothetical protein PRNP1_002062 [Phytophthora ramorum]